MASPRDRSYYEAYARGVNAFIGTHGSKLPIEFRILGYAPKPWLPEDSVVVANSMVKDLNYHYFFDALDSRKNSGQAGAGTDGGLVCEPFVARSSAHGHARRSERTRHQQRRFGRG